MKRICWSALFWGAVFCCSLGSRTGEWGVEGDLATGWAGFGHPGQTPRRAETKHWCQAGQEQNPQSLGRPWVQPWLDLFSQLFLSEGNDFFYSLWLTKCCYVIERDQKKLHNSPVWERLSLASYSLVHFLSSTQGRGRQLLSLQLLLLFFLFLLPDTSPGFLLLSLAPKELRQPPPPQIEALHHHHHPPRKSWRQFAWMGLAISLPSDSLRQKPGRQSVA